MDSWTILTPPLNLITKANMNFLIPVPDDTFDTHEQFVDAELADAKEGYMLPLSGNRFYCHKYLSNHRRSIGHYYDFKA